MSASPSSPTLSPSQMLRVAAFALLLWISGALLIRLAMPFGVFAGGLPTMVIFAVGIAINWPTILLVQRLGGLRQDQIVSGMALGSGVAINCDGLALTWAPGLYGGVSEDLHRAAAWLLWVAGFGLIGAFIAERQG